MSQQEIPLAHSILVLVTDRKLHAFDLSHTLRVSIGRHESNDLPLTSRTASNFHAEILNEEGRIVLRDLGSTNGTFVNDERVRERELAVGDRIRMGSHIVTMNLETPVDSLNHLDPSSGNFAPGTKGHIISIRAGSEDALKTLRARGPNDVSLADLLKFLSSVARSAVVVLHRDDERARIWLKKGRIGHAEYGKAVGEKALFRLFAWREAGYQLTEFIEAPSWTIDIPIDALILEGMRQSSDLGRLAASLPPFEAPLRLKEDCPLPMSAHSPAEIEVLQGIIRHETIGHLLEASPLADATVLKLVKALLRKGVFEVSDTPSLLESTSIPQMRPR